MVLGLLQWKHSTPHSADFASQFQGVVEGGLWIIAFVDAFDEAAGTGVSGSDGVQEGFVVLWRGGLPDLLAVRDHGASFGESQDEKLQIQVFADFRYALSALFFGLDPKENLGFLFVAFEPGGFLEKLFGQFFVPPGITEIDIKEEWSVGFLQDGKTGFS